MKKTKAYVVTLYVFLGLNYFSVAAFSMLGRYLDDGFETAAISMLVLWGIGAIAFLVANVFGVASVIVSQFVEVAILRSAVKHMKLYTIPFYLLNFVYQFIIWSIVMMAFRGMLLFLLWIPFFLSWLLILESGLVVNRYISRLRSMKSTFDTPGKIHYFLQIIPVLDIISTAVILMKYGKETAQEA